MPSVSAGRYKRATGVSVCESSQAQAVTRPAQTMKKSWTMLCAQSPKPEGFGAPENLYSVFSFSLTRSPRFSANSRTPGMKIYPIHYSMNSLGPFPELSTGNHAAASNDEWRGSAATRHVLDLAGGMQSIAVSRLPHDLLGYTN